MGPPGWRCLRQNRQRAQTGKDGKDADRAAQGEWDHEEASVQSWRGITRSAKLLPGLGSGVSLLAMTPNLRATLSGGVVVVTSNSRESRGRKLPMVQITRAWSDGTPGALGPGAQPAPSFTMPTPTGSITSTRAAIASPNSATTTTLAVRLPFNSVTVRDLICRSACQTCPWALARIGTAPRASRRESTRGMVCSPPRCELAEPAGRCENRGEVSARPSDPRQDRINRASAF